MNLHRQKKTINVKDFSNVRDVALCVLMEITENSRKSHSILKETFEEAEKQGAGLSKADRAFAERVVIGTLDRMITIDAILGKFLNKPLKSQKPLIRSVLRISAYQLLYMDRVPVSAACNEGVNLVKLHKMEGLSGFVNGVLRAIGREKEAGGAKLTTFASASEKYSLPKWLCSYLDKTYGKEQAEKIYEAFLAERKETLRLNVSKVMEAEPGSGITDSEDLDARIAKAEQLVSDSLKADGFAIEKIDMEAMLRENGLPKPHGRLPLMYALTEGGDITRADAFRKGYVTVQDPASALTASYAAPLGTETVIDVCSAPGGKALAMADLMGIEAIGASESSNNGKTARGTIEARDISSQKTALIEENVKRCGFDNIKIRVLDALNDHEDSYYRADILIADLPCSGIGVIAKKPDIKYNLQSYSIGELQELQRDILFNVSRFIKPKGKLVYSTCTISKEENEDNVAWLQEELGFKLESMAKLLPGEDHDGFFISVLRKKY